MTDQQELSCPHCGARIYATDAQCVSCGVRLDERQPVHEPRREAAPAPRRAETQYEQRARPSAWWAYGMAAVITVLSLISVLAAAHVITRPLATGETRYPRSPAFQRALEKAEREGRTGMPWVSGLKPDPEQPAGWGKRWRHLLAPGLSCAVIHVTLGLLTAWGLVQLRPWGRTCAIIWIIFLAWQSLFIVGGVLLAWVGSELVSALSYGPSMPLSTASILVCLAILPPAFALLVWPRLTR